MKAKNIVLVFGSTLMFSVVIVLFANAIMTNLLDRLSLTDFTYFVLIISFGTILGVMGAAASTKLVSLTRHNIAWPSRLVATGLTLYAMYLVVQLYVTENEVRKYINLTLYERTLISPRLALYVANEWFGGISRYLFIQQTLYATLYTTSVALLEG